ncbi:MAG: ATPase, T2SS/T4P/T4SS family [Desulfobacterales bacterium]
MKKRIGDILIQMGFIDQGQLEMALMESKKTGSMLGDVLIRLDWITDEKLQMAIAVQSGAEILDTAAVVIDHSLVDKIPVEFVTKHNVFPFAWEDHTLKVATANPFDVLTKDELARMTGCRVATYLASKEWISKAVELHYKRARSIDEEIEKLTLINAGAAEAADNQIVRLADMLIEKGDVLRASDIHIEPDNNLVRIYYRIDGVLQQKHIFPKSFHQSLSTRFKIMADIDISNVNIPHDGRFKYQGGIGEINLRVSTFPTHLGETIVLRLLKYTDVVGDLSRHGFEKDDLDRFMKNLKRPYGLILSTGPTGSGKTTTLYSALMKINTPNINVMTIEDPIEHVIPTVRQTAVNPKAGLTFGNALRSAMRQDPDVILVGEIRDQETAELALRASITGHLVLSTLHTNDAASAINRMLDLGINTSILASSLVMVVAQRLLRKICPHCRTMKPCTPAEEEFFRRHELQPPPEIPQAVGCPSCDHNGYNGRIGIFEVLEVDRAMEELISDGAIHSRIQEIAVKAGTSLMFKQALKKVAGQVTSIEEIQRVVANA